MGIHMVPISNRVYEKAQRMANQLSQPVDDLIQNKLESLLDQPIIDLPADELAELQAMVYLSDDTLWTIAREHMQPDLQKRMSALMNKNSEGTITSEEYNELSSLVERGERLMLRKAEAMKLLLERGYSVTLAELEPVDG